MKPHRTQSRRLSRQRTAVAKLPESTNERRQPMEILARLAGRSNFVLRSDTPMAKGTPITALDVAGALASSTDKLGVAVGMAIACQRPIEWPIVHRLGYPRVLVSLQAQRERPGVVDGNKVFRARLALWDAFHKLIAPNTTQGMTTRAAAKQAKCGEHTYRFIVRHATAILEAAGNAAATDACRALFTRDDGEPTVATNDVGEVITWTDAGVDLIDARRARLAELLMEHAPRERRLIGCLTLRKSHLDCI